MTSKELESKITVSSEQDSQVVTIAVRDTDAKRAAVMANAVASVFQDKITAIMNVDNVSILSKAEASDSQSPAEPNRKLNIAIAFAAGLLGGIGLAFCWNIWIIRSNRKNSWKRCSASRSWERLLQSVQKTALPKCEDGGNQTSGRRTC